MTWVRYDDQAAIHRKVAPLDDATYRLWREAIEWCSRNLTDGHIATIELADVSKRANVQRAAKLVDRGLWHPAGTECGSLKCPPPADDGWTIHDYWDYQFTREHVIAEKAAKAARQKRWLDKQADRRKKNASTDGTRDASHDASGDARPVPDPVPAPKGSGDEDVPEKRPAAADAFGAAERRKAKPCPTCGNSIESAYHRNTCRATLGI